MRHVIPSLPAPARCLRRPPSPPLSRCPHKETAVRATLGSVTESIFGQEPELAASGWWKRGGFELLPLAYHLGFRRRPVPSCRLQCATKVGPFLGKFLNIQPSSRQYYCSTSTIEITLELDYAV